MDKKALKKHMAEIGRKGGQVSRKEIPPDEQERMQAGRMAAKEKKKTTPVGEGKK